MLKSARWVNYCLLSLLLLLSWSAVASSTVYKSYDEQGNVIFSDKPQSQAAETLELPPLQTYKPPPPPERTTRSSDPTTKLIEPPAAIPNYTIEIVQPENKGTVWNNQGNVQVIVRVSPGLREQDKVLILADGKAMGEPSKGTSVIIEGLDRGEHTLQAQVVDDTGSALASSPPSIVYVHQTTTFNRPGPRP